RNLNMTSKMSQINKPLETPIIHSCMITMLDRLSFHLLVFLNSFYVFVHIETFQYQSGMVLFVYVEKMIHLKITSFQHQSLLHMEFGSYMDVSLFPLLISNVFLYVLLACSHQNENS